MGAPRHAVVAALMTAAVLPLTACGSDGEPQTARPGDQIVARSDVEVGDLPKSYVLLPTGRLDVQAGEPVDQIAADDARDRESRTAADGSVFVPLTWTYDTNELADLDSVFGKAGPVSLALVSGEQRYGLAPPHEDTGGTDSEAYYVAVDGAADDLALEVEYAGVTQTLDLRTGKRREGRAKGLYAVDSYTATTTPCPSKHWVDEDPEVQVYFSCTITRPLTVPFVQGEWAGAGHTFVVIGLTTNLTAYTVLNGTEGAATYTATSGKDKTELGGLRPTSVLGELEQGAVSGGYLVFEVKAKAPRTLSFRRTYQLQQSGVQGEVEAPERITFEIRGDVPLR